MKFNSAAVAATFLCGTLAFAQMGPRGPRGPREFGPHLGKVVTGAPYKADVAATSVQTLADGNIIQRTTTGVVARDSPGRTYSSETITGMFGQTGTKTMTFISDPVAGYVYTLNAATKTAMRRPLRAHNGTGANARAEWSGHTGTRPADSNVVSSTMNAQIVNGVNAEGKTVTHTIPAGSMGNEKPIVATTETWYSPELQVVISSKRVDPREGTSAYAITNIQRTEPPATLFQVPSDYTIKDAPAFGGR
jgi:hypothetical protein